MTTSAKNSALSIIHTLANSLFSAKLDSVSHDQAMTALEYVAKSHDVDCIMACLDCLDVKSADIEKLEYFGSALQNAKQDVILPLLTPLVESTNLRVSEHALFLLGFAHDKNCVGLVLNYLKRNDATFEGVEIARDILAALNAANETELSEAALNDALPAWFMDANRDLLEREQKYLIERALVDADSALGRKDYSSVITLLEPYEGTLNQEGQRKLKLARLRLRGTR